MCGVRTAVIVFAQAGIGNGRSRPTPDRGQLAGQFLAFIRERAISEGSYMYVGSFGRIILRTRSL